MKKLLITGKTSRFAKYLKIEIKNFNTVYPSKKEFNILKYKQIDKFIAKKKNHSSNSYCWFIKTNEYA